jgi:hypothetical protein
LNHDERPWCKGKCLHQGRSVYAGGFYAYIYSLIETAKDTSLDPYRYLLWVLKTAPALAQTDENWATKLIPAGAPDFCKIS